MSKKRLHWKTRYEGWILSSGLPANHQLILNALKFYANSALDKDDPDHRPVTWVGQITLAEHFGMNKSTVCRILTRLDRLRIIEKSKRNRRGGWDGNKYHLNPPPGFGPDYFEDSGDVVVTDLEPETTDHVPAYDANRQDVEAVVPVTPETEPETEPAEPAGSLISLSQVDKETQDWVNLQRDRKTGELPLDFKLMLFTNKNIVDDLAPKTSLGDLADYFFDHNPKIPSNARTVRDVKTTFAKWMNEGVTGFEILRYCDQFQHEKPEFQNLQAFLNDKRLAFNLDKIRKQKLPA